MKIIFYILLLLSVFGCTKTSEEQYDFDALKDSLHLIPGNYIFIKDFSPLYSDNNPYELDHNNRIKAVFLSLYYNENREREDTAVYGVTYNNMIEYEGCSKDIYDGESIMELVNWMINNREKI